MCAFEGLYHYKSGLFSIEYVAILKKFSLLTVPEVVIWQLSVQQVPKKSSECFSVPDKAHSQLVNKLLL